MTDDPILFDMIEVLYMKLDWKTCGRIGVTAFLLYLAMYYWESVAGLGSALLGASGALLVGCVIAYILNILMSLYERWYFPNSTNPAVGKSRRLVCMAAAMVSLVAVVVLIVRLVIPELMACVSLLMAEIPAAIQSGVDWLQESGVLESLLEEEFLLKLDTIDWQAKVIQAAKLLLEGLGGAATVAMSTVTSLISAVTTLVIGLIFAIYLLFGKERLCGQFSRLMDRYLKPGLNKKLRHVLATLNDCFHKFIVGQCTEAVILGLLCMAGMSLLRFPYAVMVGTLVGFTALIPVAGAYIGAGVGAFMILTVDPLQAVAFLVFIVVLQQLEGNIIYPRVVGTSIGLPGVWVLATVTVAGGILGIPGMLLGVPVAAAVYRLLREDVNKG